MPEHPASSAASTVAKEELQVTADKRISISFVKQRSSSAILAVANLDRPSGSLSLAFGGVAIAALFYTSIRRRKLVAVSYMTSLAFVTPSRGASRRQFLWLRLSIQPADVEPLHRPVNGFADLRRSAPCRQSQRSRRPSRCASADRVPGRTSKTTIFPPFEMRKRPARS